ncbi:MAG TPA: beta-glucosidase BglX [Prolixibacteraceae bacterium]|nr:beta-glucosidase BglX [Prolixibacteraceae bacterium]
MNKLTILLLYLAGLVLPVCAQQNEMDRFITDLLGKMTLQEKIGQLNQVVPGGGAVTGSGISQGVETKIKEGKVGSMLNSPSVEYTRKAQELAVTTTKSKIPILFGLDVIHGYKTIFPIPLALSCSWDIDQIERSARIAAIEASSAGVGWTFSPMVDISRDPRWGRVAEGGGEDPYLGSRIAEAMVKGYQGNDLRGETSILACVKHFALYGASEAGRDYNTVDMSRLSMYQYYFPPYKAAVDAGAGSVMTSFNVIDGVPSTGNHWLHTEVLRNQWGFNGFVVTDYNAILEMIPHGLGDIKTVSALALNAGVDMDMVDEGFLSTLEKSVEDGSVSVENIDKACRRILEMKYKLGLFDNPYRFINEERMKTDLLSAQHRKAAREISQRSIVLLKNSDKTLPLKKEGRIAVVGPLAKSKIDMLGTWTISGDPSEAVTLVEGITNVGGNKVSVNYARGSQFTTDPMLQRNGGNVWVRVVEEKTETVSDEKMLSDALEAARKADVIVAAVGESAGWSGEASSRSDITIPECQKQLLKKLKETGKPVVVVVFSGRPLDLSWEESQFSTIIQAWHGGTEAGNALADVLFGDYNPSGKLSMSFPRSVGQIPVYYNHFNTGRPYNAMSKFSSKYLDVVNDPLFPFGYGLSYSTFEYGNIELSNNKPVGETKIEASVVIKNTSKYAGEEVVQLYISDKVAAVSRPVKELKGFKKVMLQPGESKKVTFEIGTKELKYYNNNLEYQWEPGDFVVYIGTSSADNRSANLTWMK